MRKVKKMYNELDEFLKLTIVVVSVVSFSWSLSAPVIVKLQGTYWALTLISLYSIMIKLGAFIAPYLEHLSLKKIYTLVIMVDTIYLVSIMTYFIDEKWLLYLEAAAAILYSIILTAFAYNFDSYLSRNYGSKILKEYKYVSNIATAAAAVAGSGVIALLNKYLTIDAIVGAIIAPTIIMLALQLYMYKNYWSKLDENSEQ